MARRRSEARSPRLPHPLSVERVSFSSVRRAASDPRARRAALRHAATGARAPLVLDQPGQIVTAVFSPAGDLVATGGRDDLAMIWDARRRHPAAHARSTAATCSTSRGRRTAALLATASADNGGRVFRTDTGALLTFLGAHSNQVVGVDFSPDGASVVTASRDGSARIWGEDGFARSAALLGHSGDVLDAMFTPDGRSVVTASDDGSARVWKPAVDPILSLVGRHTAAGRAVAVAPDGRIASVGLDGTLRVWRRDGRSVRVIPQPAQAVDVAFSRDGSLLVTAGADGVARVWGADDGRLRQSFTHGAPLTSAAFDRAATRVVDGRRRRDRAGVRPHGRRAAAAPARRRRRDRGHVQPGRPLRRDRRRRTSRGGSGAPGTAKAGRQAHRPARGRPDRDRVQPGRQADRDGEPRRATRISGTRPSFTWRRALRGHASVVSDVVFSPDGRWIATAGPTTVGMWKTETGRRIDKGTPVLFLRGHGPRVRSVAFFPDSRRVASIGDDGTVRTYLCELCGTAPQLAVRARRLLDRLGSNLTADERKSYIGG